MKVEITTADFFRYQSKSTGLDIRQGRKDGMKAFYYTSSADKANKLYAALSAAGFAATTRTLTAPKHAGMNLVTVAGPAFTDNEELFRFYALAMRDAWINVRASI